MWNSSSRNSQALHSKEVGGGGNVATPEVHQAPLRQAGGVWGIKPVEVKVCLEKMALWHSCTE